MSRHRQQHAATFAAALLPLALASSALGAQQAASNGARHASDSLPRTLRPRPTTSAITTADLMTRVYLFADDSMQGRDSGTPGHERAVAYLVRELRRIGLRPGGADGGWYHDVPLERRSLDARAELRIDGQPLAPGSEFAPANFRGAVRGVDGRYETVYAGSVEQLRALPSERIAGKVVILAPQPQLLTGQPLEPRELLSAAAAVVLPILDDLSPRVRGLLAVPMVELPSPNTAAPPTIVVTRAAAERMLGTPLAAAQPGAVGIPVTARVGFERAPLPSRNVVAVLPGRDRALRGQYVAVGAHADHVGIAPRAVDHDSLKVWLATRRRIFLRQDDDGDEVLTPEQQRTYARETAAIVVNTDSLRRLRPARPDSIYNGAEDNASGAMSLLEIAEELASRRVRPRRPLLFVWYTAEEKGLLGSEHFVEHPPVPRDSIVANVNLDHAGGRATSTDHRSGGPNYLNLVGSAKLSPRLDSLVLAVNARQPNAMHFDRALERAGHALNVLCRSDHASYGRWGIPNVLLSSAFFADYHQVTDEPQYLDYAHLARTTRLTRDVVLALADLSSPLTDSPRPRERTDCRQ